MKQPVIIFGANGIGRAALEIFISAGIEVYGFLDDDSELHGTAINDVSILGAPDDDGFLKLIGKKTGAFVAADDNALRQSLIAMLKDRRKVMPMNAIHSAALVPDSVHLGYGNFINAGVIVGGDCKIPNHCIVNSGAILEHGCSLEDFVQIGAGSLIGSGVKIGEAAFVGSGATVVAGVNIGAKAQVGAGSVVVRDVEAGETVFGNPAEPMSM